MSLFDELGKRQFVQDMLVVKEGTGFHFRPHLHLPDIYLGHWLLGTSLRSCQDQSHYKVSYLHKRSTIPSVILTWFATEHFNEVIWLITLNNVLIDVTDLLLGTEQVISLTFLLWRFIVIVWEAEIQGLCRLVAFFFSFWGLQYYKIFNFTHSTRKWYDNKITPNHVFFYSITEFLWWN